MSHEPTASDRAAAEIPLPANRPADDAHAEWDPMEQDPTEQDPTEHHAADDPERTAPLPSADPELAHAYSERLYAAWWVWLLPVIGATLLASSIHIGYPQLPEWLPYAVLLPIALLIDLALSRTGIHVTNTDSDPELHVGQARLPVRFIGSVEIIDKRFKQTALGPDFDPAAFLVHRGSIGPVLRLELTDPADATPCWLVSTRKPRKLARALGAPDA